LYDSKEATAMVAAQPQQKDTSTMSTWVFPVMGMFAMLSLSAAMAVRSRGARSSQRELNFAQPQMEGSVTDGEPLLEEGVVLE